MKLLSTPSRSMKAYVDETVADSWHRIAVDPGMKRPTKEGASPSLEPEGGQQRRRATSVDAGSLAVAVGHSFYYNKGGVPMTT